MRKSLLKRWLTSGTSCSSEKDNEMQKKLPEYYNDSFKKGNLVTRKQLKSKALEFSNRGFFKASNSWIRLFVKKNRLLVSNEREYTRKML